MTTLTQLAQTTGGGSGIDSTLFLGIVTLLFGALSTVSGLLYHRVVEENKELKDENKEQAKRLAEYERYAPPLVDVVEEQQLHSYPSRRSSGATSPRRRTASSDRDTESVRPRGRRRQLL